MRECAYVVVVVVVVVMPTQPSSFNRKLTTHTFTTSTHPTPYNKIYFFDNQFPSFKNKMQGVVGNELFFARTKLGKMNMSN